MFWSNSLANVGSDIKCPHASPELCCWGRASSQIIRPRVTLRNPTVSQVKLPSSDPDPLILCSCQRSMSLDPGAARVDSACRFAAYAVMFRSPLRGSGTSGHCHHSSYLCFLYKPNGILLRVWLRGSEERHSGTGDWQPLLSVKNEPFNFEASSTFQPRLVAWRSQW